VPDITRRKYSGQARFQIERITLYAPGLRTFSMGQQQIGPRNKISAFVSNDPKFDSPFSVWHATNTDE
jgi:hypothetical protein